LIVGGGPAGISAALYLSKRGHDVTLTEKEAHLGGQFSFAWQAPGKKTMKMEVQDQLLIILIALVFYKIGFHSLIPLLEYLIFFG
jgi:NADPH-dependent 2,4-dienoyl-CoA reductase/sulfur reductase-like enzyme